MVGAEEEEVRDYILRERKNILLNGKVFILVELDKFQVGVIVKVVAVEDQVLMEPLSLHQADMVLQVEEEEAEELRYLIF